MFLHGQWACAGALRSVLAACFALGSLNLAWSANSAAGVEPAKKSATALTASEIVAKNVAARGGHEAWRKVQTMVWTGSLQSDRTPVPSMPFLLDQKRPNKTRFELHAMSEHSVRVFDGTQGWKTHSASGAAPIVKPFTPEENRFAAGEHTIDGPLMNLAPNGNTVTLVGTEQVEGRKAYHLNLRLASGEREEVWVDTKTFLEVKVARMTYDATGMPRMVPTVYRDYKPFQGLQVPTTIQIGDGSTGTPDRMQIDHVALNMALDDRLFENPGTINRPRRASARGSIPAATPGTAAPVMPAAPTAAVAAEPEALTR